MIKKVATVFLTLGFAFNVWADVNVESIRYEDSAVVGQTTLQLNGAGLRKKVFFKVYAAGLYVPQKAQTAQGILEQNGAARVRLGLLRDVSAKSFVSALEEGLQDNTDEATRKEIAPELAKLIDAMNKIGDVKEGDLVDFEFSGKTTTVLVNGKLVADNIGGKKLFDSVLRIWLGENAIDDACIQIKDTRIAYAGARAAAPEFAADTIIDGKGGIALPGLVNAHTHLPMTLVRGVGTDLPLMDWLHKIWPLEDKLTPELMRIGTQMSCIEALRTGTTCFADAYMMSETIAQTVADAGMRLNICRMMTGETAPEKMAEQRALSRPQAMDRHAMMTMMPPTVSTKRSRCATSASGNSPRSMKSSSRYSPPSTMTDISMGIKTSSTTSSPPKMAAAVVQPR